MKRYRKRHPSEVASCFVNLGLVLDRLNFGIPFQSVEYGFLRSEGEGIYRIGQTGTCTYIHLVVPGTIDMKIMNALKSKSDLAKSVVDNWRSIIGGD